MLYQVHCQKFFKKHSSTWCVITDHGDTTGAERGGCSGGGEWATAVRRENWSGPG